VVDNNTLVMVGYDRLDLGEIETGLVSTNTFDQNCSYLYPFIERWITLAPDAWVGTASVYTDLLLQCMHRKLYRPPNIWQWAAITYPPSSAWQYVGSLTQNAWEPSANFTDPIFGNTQLFSQLIHDRYGFTASSYEAQQAITGELIIQVIRQTQSLDKNVLKKALESFNGSTIVNAQTYFQPGTHQTSQQRLCFQVLDVNNTANVVYPKNYVNLRPIISPYNFVIDRAFLNQFKPKKGLTQTNLILIITFSVLGLILILIAIGLLIGWKKYHWVFISKDEPQNWEHN